MPTYDLALESYVRALFGQEEDEFVSIREKTVAAGLPQIMIAPEEGRFLEFLAVSIGARNALEIGTLGGYSGSWIARGLAEGGRLLTIEQDAMRAQLARDNLDSVGLGHLVEVRNGNAHKILSEVSDEGPFDLIFIDAEKEGYPRYYAWAIENLAPGGILAAHNAFSHGAVVDDEDQRERTKALRRFSEQLASNSDFVSLIYPAGDGIAFGVKRS
ncbi:MAG: O-methyltransferase [Anaerolineales bacterium]|jgi:caffeoyl-CoA O-methyltransferase